MGCKWAVWQLTAAGGSVHGARDHCWVPVTPGATEGIRYGPPGENHEMDLQRLCVLLALGGCAHASPPGDQVRLPDGSPGIGFDDLRYSPTLHRVLVPAGRTGRLDLIDPDTLAVTSIAGFSRSAAYGGGHDDGPTSVDERQGLLFVTDRTSQELRIVDPVAKAILTSMPLMGHPDYVRYASGTDQFWITEPGNEQIEILAIDKRQSRLELNHAGTIHVGNGPESLVIDEVRHRAYTHRWQASTVAIDLQTRATVAEWPNGCAASRGIALDASRGFLLAACLEGTVTVLDVAHGGQIVSSVAKGAGFDVMGYNPALGHAYMAGSACNCLIVLGLSSAGHLSFLDRQDAPADTHCVTADDRGHAWVCDPGAGRLLRITDSHPRSWN
jgi:hypothetical protein